MSEAPRYNAWLLDRARPFLGPRALDVGAGIGTFTAELARMCDRVVAVEPEPDDLTVLRQRFADNDRVHVTGLDALALDGADLGGPFDAAVCFNVLEHIPNDTGALRAIASQLREGGHLLLLVPAHGALYGQIDCTVGHERRYDRSILRTRLRDANYDVRVLRHVNPLGALGWFVSSRLLGSEHIPEGPLRAYDRLVPVLRALDRVRLPFGLSLWAVARRAKTTGSASANAANA
jgi:SAM-dependent methyltransferase